MTCAISVNPKETALHRHLKPLSSPENGVQIWIAELDSVSRDEIKRLFASLDASEHTRAEEFRSKQDRHRYVAAHGLLRLALGEILGRPANTLLLERFAQEKPKLRQSERAERSLKFNLSHAAGWALIAIGWDRELGVDLESAKSLPDDEQSLFKLAARVLSEPEVAAWRTIPSSENRCAEFLRMWTRKEAYVKATGEGLRHDLVNIELPTDAAMFAVPSAKRPMDRWIVHDLSVPTEFTAALAIEVT